MAEPKSPTTARPKAPGPDVVEALANGTAAGFVAAALEEAEAALRADYIAAARKLLDDGQEPHLRPGQRAALSSLTNLAAQLVTATTVPGGAS